MEDTIGEQIANALSTQFTSNLPAVVGVIVLFVGTGIVIRMVKKHAKP